MAMQRVLLARFAASVLGKQSLLKSSPPCLAATAVRLLSTTKTLGSGHDEVDYYDVRERCGNREIVGFGINGDEYYVDRMDNPYPAIRFQVRDQPGIVALQKKEQGDWKQLSVDEVKQLYRHSFCQTLEEVVAPTGHWKAEWAVVSVMLAATLFYYYWLKFYVYGDLEPSQSPEWQEAMLQRMIDQHQEPITGVASKWDYENNRWKA